MSDKNINVEQAVESIRCAFLNLNNVKTLGVVAIKMVKLQLNDALKSLGEEDMIEL